MPIEYEVLPFFDWLFPAVGRGYGALAQFVASASLLTRDRRAAATYEAVGVRYELLP